MADEGIYHGRLMADGQGNLLADESTLDAATGDATYGENHGKPVAYHEGSYIFLKKGEDSHNKRHSAGETLEVAGTTDASNPGEEHHEVPASDDPHVDDEGNVSLMFDPDSVAATVTGHTDAYSGGGEE